MKKGVIAIQYWRGDIDKAMRLARLIADLEPTRRDDVDFVFIARADCDHDEAAVQYVSRKFNVRKLKCIARATGHPWGCWVLWYSLMEWFYLGLQSGKLPEYKWIFPFEADCVPISRTWINECHEEFISSRVNLLGSETFHYSQHLNGNLMASSDLDFLKWLIRDVTVAGVPRQEPWDIYLFPKFTQWGVGFSSKIINRCGQRTMEQKEVQWLQSHGWAFVHGVKDDSLFHFSRTGLLGR